MVDEAPTWTSSSVQRDRHILTTAGAIAVLSVAVKGATALRELLVAWYFGLSGPLDAYLIAYAVPYFLITLLAGSLPQVLIPAYVRLRTRGPVWAGERLIWSVSLLSVIVLVVVALIVGASAPAFIPLVGRGFTNNQLELAEHLTLILAPTIITTVLVSLAGAVLNAREHFVVPAVSPMLNTITVILVLVGLVSSLGIFALAIGVVGGTCVELGLLGFLAFKQVRLRPSRAIWTPHTRELSVRLGATLVGAGLMAATVLVDQAMSSDLGTGSVAALNYAIRIVTVPLALTAAALGTVVLPHFSAMVSLEQWTDVSRTLRRYLLAAGFVTTPIALAVALLARPITEVLLQRGAFSAQDALEVAPTLAAAALQIPFYTCVILLMRLALALRLNTWIAVISAINLALNVVLNAWLASIISVAGIALSTSIVYMCSFLMLLVVTTRRLRINIAHSQ